MAVSATGTQGGRTRALAFLAVLLISALCGIAFRPTLSLWFTGIDAFPLILSSRLESAAEIPQLFARQYLSAYENVAIAGSVGVRPVGSFLFALDYWFWGLQPLGYHLTNLILHGLNAVLVFFLARRLKVGHPYFVPLFAAVLFAIHPLHFATVPLLPARFDQLLCLFSLLSLIALVRYRESGGKADLAFSLIAAGLGLGAKEAGLAVAAVAVFSMLYWAATDTRKPSSIVLPIGMFLALVAAFVLYRTWAIGGLGGYPLDPQDLVHRPMIFAKWFSATLFCPLPLSQAGWALALWKILVAAFAVIGAGLLGGAVLAIFRSKASLLVWMEGQIGRDAQVLFLLTVWEFAFFAGLGLADLLTGVFKPLYVYTPLTFWCIVMSGLTFHAAQFLRTRWGSSFGRKVGDYGAALLSLLLVLLIASLAMTSPLLRGFDEWATASHLGEQYVAALGEVMDRLPARSTVLLVNLPREIQCREGPCVGRIYVFEDYSIDGWRKLVFPHKELQFIGLSALRMTRNEVGMRTTLQHRPTENTILIRNSAGTIEKPWRPRKAACATAEFEDAHTQLRIRFQPGSLKAERCYVFDFFVPGRLFSLRTEDLRSLGTAPNP